MKIQKIYIHSIDGTDVWLPVDANNIKDNEYEILENEEYVDPEPNELFEFFPGDIVEIGSKIFKDGTNRQVAKKLINTGNWTDRKFIKFKYLATFGKLSIDLRTAKMYNDEIERIKENEQRGQFYYQAMIETVDKLYSLIINDKNQNTTNV